MRRLASSPTLWSAEGAQPVGKGRARRATLIGKFWFGVWFSWHHGQDLRCLGTDRTSLICSGPEAARRRAL